MKYQNMPPLSEPDLIALEKSVRTHGIQVPIIVDEEGEVIDGHHRKEIAERLGIYLPTETREYLEESQKVALSISLNIDRRQLTREQKREIIAASVKASPELPDREHARRVGASPSTVGSIRNDLESSGDVSKLDTRIDSLGREQPASKPDRPVISIVTRQSESVTETFDAETGEQVEALEPWFPPEVEQRAEAKRSARAEVDKDPAVQDARYMHEFYKSVTKGDDFLQFDPERIGSLAEQADFVTIEQLIVNTQAFLAKMHRARRGLRLVKGKGK